MTGTLTLNLDIELLADFINHLLARICQRYDAQVKARRARCADILYLLPLSKSFVVNINYLLSMYTSTTNFRINTAPVPNPARK